MEVYSLEDVLNNSARVNITPPVPPVQLDPVQTLTVQIIFYVVYVLIFIIGVIGNCMLLYAILRNSSVHSVTNYFIANLAVADLLLCFLCVPFTPLYTFIGSWVFGSFLCHVVTSAQGISIYISSLTLTVIALDRLYIMLYPFKPRMSEQLCAGLIAATWAFSLVATMPYAYFVRHRYLEEYNIYICQENFPPGVRVAFGGITTVLQFVIPFIVLLVAYTIISIKVTKRANNRPGARSALREKADQERKIRTNRMLVAMVTVFGVSWLPLNLLNLLDDISTNAGFTWHQWQYFHLLFFVSHSFAMSSTCYNPLLYAWLNESFRTEFLQNLPFLSRTRRSETSGRAETTQSGHGSLSARMMSCFNRAHSVESHSHVVVNNETHLALKLIKNPQEKGQHISPPDHDIDSNARMVQSTV